MKRIKKKAKIVFEKITLQANVKKLIKKLYVVNMGKVNYQCDCPVTVLLYLICDISQFAEKLAAFLIYNTSSESI